jgi:hypothetical protein
LGSEPFIRRTIPITSGIVVAPPTTVSAIPAAFALVIIHGSGDKKSDAHAEGNPGCRKKYEFWN